MIRSYNATCLTLVIGFGLLGLGCVGSTSTLPNTPESEFTPLFDGKTLDGWRTVGGDGTYHVEDASIVGVCKNTRRNTFLRTERTYSDFEFRAQFKWDTLGNSGLQYRSQQHADDDGNETGRVYGYQYELDSSDRAWSAGLYEEGRRGWLVNLESEEDASKRAAVTLEDWNDIVIECKGTHIRTWLNGIEIVDYEDIDAEKALADGFFALQVHAGGSGQYRWRNLRIKELNTDQ